MNTSAQKIFQSKNGTTVFISSTSLEDITAVNKRVDSKIASNGQMTFIIPIKGFVFENPIMQEHFNENYMESSKFPKAVFMGTISNKAEVVFDKDGIYKTTVNGDMTMHGITKKITAIGTIEIKDGKPIVKSHFKIKLSDYKIGGTLIGEKIASEVDVTIECNYE